MQQACRLTVRQKQVLTFFEERRRQTGFAPTLQETAAHFGFKSVNSVRQHLQLIEKKGFLHRVPGRSRALVFPDHSEDTHFVRVPLLGRIAAGTPLVTNEEAETVLTLPASLFHGSNLFALRVKGESMNGAGILSGDIAVLDATSEVTDGAIAAVLIEDEATLKRVYRKNQELVLKAENPVFAEIKISASDSRRVRVIGLLIGVLRTI